MGLLVKPNKQVYENDNDKITLLKYEWAPNSYYLSGLTLDVTGKPTDVNVVDGIIPPRITGDQLRAKSGPYGHAPKS